MLRLPALGATPTVHVHAAAVRLQAQAGLCTGDHVLELDLGLRNDRWQLAVARSAFAIARVV